LLQSIDYSKLEKFVERDGFFHTKFPSPTKDDALNQQANLQGQEGADYQIEDGEEGNQTTGHRAVFLRSSSQKFAGQQPESSHIAPYGSIETS